MFNHTKSLNAMRREIKRETKRETKKQFKQIMTDLYNEEQNGNATHRPLHEDEKLMLDFARLELNAERVAQIRNA